MSRADEELVERFLRDRDEEAFAELYRRHTRALYNFALRLGGEAAAADVVQEAWMRAARGLARFRWQSSLRTWLFGVALNCWRETARTPAEAFADGETDRVGAPDPVVRLDLERAVAALAPGFRLVFLLHDVHGFTHREIADILGIEEGASKSQLSRARARLRARWSGSSG
jgi:RNA polymerase sigma-70 factor (ECF subfamily)